MLSTTENNTKESTVALPWQRIK